MPVNFKCSCSAVQEIPDDQVGKPVRCYLCGEVTTVPDPAAAPSAGAAAASPSPEGKPWQSAAPREPAPKTSNSSVLGGELMMIVAVIWFVGGLFFDVIFIYPPILFVVGLVTCLRGLGEKPN